MDQEQINELKLMICDRLTPEELIEALGVPVEEVFERFLDECLELSYEDLL